MAPGGFEPPTFRLSVERSTRLSYEADVLLYSHSFLKLFTLTTGQKSTGQLRVSYINNNISPSIMKLNIAGLEYGHNDARNQIKIPSALSSELAYFLGIHFGDGCMNINKRKRHVDYILAYTGSFDNDCSWFKEKLAPLIYTLFNKQVTPRPGTKNTVMILFRSKVIVQFLHHICGMPLGNKTNANVPKLIQNAPPAFQKAFIRGLADTDFSITFKKRHKTVWYCPVITRSTASKLLWEWLKLKLPEFGFKIYSNWRINERNGKKHPSYYLDINGKDSLLKWIREIGFGSCTNLSRINCWKLAGAMPPSMNLNEREAFLQNALKK